MSDESHMLFSHSHYYYIFPIHRARITLPHFVEVVDDEEGSVRVVAAEVIPTKTKLGPYEAKKTTQVIEAEDGFILRVSTIFLQAYFFTLICSPARILNGNTQAP